jgi:hypothetical protein
MIQIHHENGMFCPYFHCDVCGRKIDDFRKANAIFDFPPGQNESVLIRHVHKVCDGGSEPYWVPLDEHLLSLLYNSGLKSREFKRIMRETCWRLEVA